MTGRKITSDARETWSALKDGAPDVYNGLPRRIVPKSEAKEKDWGGYFTGEPCAHGHVSNRRIHNDNCIDCERIRAGKPALSLPADQLVADAPSELVAFEWHKENWAAFLRSYVNSSGDIEASLKKVGGTMSDLITQIEKFATASAEFEDAKRKAGKARRLRAEGLDSEKALLAANPDLFGKGMFGDGQATDPRMIDAELARLVSEIGRESNLLSGISRQSVRTDAKPRQVEHRAEATGAAADQKPTVPPANDPNSDLVS